MKVSDLLDQKGRDVVIIHPDASIGRLAVTLREKWVGAAVVSRDGISIEGLASERDVVRGLAENACMATTPVSKMMRRYVVTCAPEDDVASLARKMTEQRLRHVPVVENDWLVGMVSIGDVAKGQLKEKQLEANVLRDLALASRAANSDALV